MSNIETLILTLSKYVIHNARLKGTQPSKTIMLNVLKIEAQKEKYGAQARNSLDKFENKWGELARILD